MSEKLVHATEDSFDALVSGHPLVLVDFWASWCGPCRMLGPIMDELAEKYEGRAVVAKVNTEEEPDLAARFNVQSIPNVLLFKNGQMIENEVGVRPLQHFEALLDKNI
ncbi:thioredoxin [Anaeromassilibacillus senegalensis]|uniref:thioredoxin n=1 Tax=Anaeromassilibacillus senegalensis TaxID=1673717 RepID=UPI0006824DBA|nr:thioredoxin [Anaeromassilibacillus senegalensis]